MTLYGRFCGLISVQPLLFLQLVLSNFLLLSVGCQWLPLWTGLSLSFLVGFEFWCPLFFFVMAIFVISWSIMLSEFYFLVTGRFWYWLQSQLKLICPVNFDLNFLYMEIWIHQETLCDNFWFIFIYFGIFCMWDYAWVSFQHWQISSIFYREWGSWIQRQTSGGQTMLVDKSFCWENLWTWRLF